MSSSVTTPKYVVKCPRDNQDIEFTLTLEEIEKILNSPSGIYEKRIKHFDHEVVVVISQDFVIRDVYVRDIRYLSTLSEVEEIDLTEYELDEKARQLLSPREIECIEETLRTGTIRPDIMDLVITLIELGLLRKKRR